MEASRQDLSDGAIRFALSCAVREISTFLYFKVGGVQVQGSTSYIYNILSCCYRMEKPPREKREELLRHPWTPKATKRTIRRQFEEEDREFQQLSRGDQMLKTISGNLQNVGKVREISAANDLAALLAHPPKQGSRKRVPSQKKKDTLPVPPKGPKSRKQKVTDMVQGPVLLVDFILQEKKTHYGYRCKACGFTSPNNQNVRRHCYLQHLPPQTYICHCGRKYHKHSSFSYHKDRCIPKV